MLANRFRSGRVPHQHIGISSFTENKLVLDVIGNANITNDLTVGGQLNAPSIIVTGTSPAQFDDVIARNLQISGIATFLGNVSIAGTLTYEDVTNIDSLGIITARTGLDIQSGTVSIGGSTGNDAQYLRSTGIGVTWSDFPTLRTEQRFVTAAGDTTFDYQYNIGFIDVFYNGVRLSPDAEYYANNGTSITLLSPAFEGDILEIIAYNTVTTGGGGSGSGGSGGGARVSVGNTAPSNSSSGDLWWKSNEGQLKIYYTDLDSSQWVDAAAGGGGGGAVSYTLTPATDTQLGGVKVGTGLTISAAGILSATGSGGSGGGSSTLDGLTDTSISSPQTGQVLKYQAGSGWVNDSASGGLSDIVSDTTPQLGGDLDVNGRKIVTTSNSHILLQPNGTGKVGIGNVIVPYSLFHVKGSYPRITLQKTGQFDDAGIDFRTDAGVVGAAISHVSDGNNLVLNVLGSEKLRVTNNGLKVTGVSTFNGNVDVNGNLDVSGTINGLGNIAFPHGTSITFNVKVVSKTAAHRYFGIGSAKGYTIDDVESPFLTLTPGRTYRFDQSDASNSTHPIKFYYEGDRTTEYTSGVTFNGSAGNAGSYTEITISDSTPIVLHYQCYNHPYMGNSIQSNSNKIDTSYDTVLKGKLNVTDTATFTGIVDVNNIFRAVTVVAENITENSVVYAGAAGQLKGDSNILYDENTFKVNNKNLQVNNAHTQLNTVNVSGISTVVGVGTFKSDVYIDNNAYVGNELYVKGLKITSGDENDPPSYGEDVSTRNLKVSGISTFIGLTSFTSAVEYHGNVHFKNNNLLYFGGSLPNDPGYNGGSDAKLSINGNVSGKAYITAGGGGSTGDLTIRTSDLFIEDKGSVGIVTVRDSGVTVAGIVTANSFEGDGSTLTLGSINQLSDVSASSPSDGYVLKWNNAASQWQPAVDATTGGGGGGGSETVIVPVAYAKVNQDTSGTGTNISWGAYNSSNGEMTFTFTGAQADTNYYVLAEREQYDTHSVSITNKTTTGFKATWLGNDGTSPLAPSVFGGVLIVYASTPTTDVGGTLSSISATNATPTAGSSSINFNSNTGQFTFTPYALPTSSASTLGGIKIGSGLSIDGNGVVSAPAVNSVDGLTDTVITSATNGDIIQWSGTKWVNVPLSDSTGITRYASTSAFPTASTSEGQLAYSNNNDSLYLSNGTDWTGQRIVTTDSSVSSDFGSLDSALRRTYDITSSDYTGGNGTFNAARKKIILGNDKDATETSVILSAGTGLTLSRGQNSQSEYELGIGLDTSIYSISAENSSGPNDSILRLSNLLDSAQDDIVFKGAGGLVVSRDDENTLRFTQGGSGVTQWTDELTKDAAQAMLCSTAANALHSNISFSYNSTTKLITAQSSGGSSSDTTYDLGGSTTGSNAILTLAGSDSTNDTIELVGSNGTSIAWDNSAKRVTITSATVSQTNWNLASGAGSILNKPVLKDIATTGNIKDALDTAINEPSANNVLKYDSGSSKWVASTNPISGLTDVSTATPGDGEVLKWSSTNSQWEPASDISGTSGSTNFKGLDDTPNTYGGKAGKYLKVNVAEDALEYADSASANVIGDISGTSASIASNAYDTLNLTGHIAYTLFKVKVSKASWVRIYCDNASRVSDSTRSWGNDPLPGSGVIAEVTTTTDDQEVLVTPGIFGFNNDSPSRTNTIYAAINNRSGSANGITVTLTVLKIGE